MPETICPSFINGGQVAGTCRRFIGNICTFSCDPGCNPTRENVYCNYYGRWEDGEQACLCGTGSGTDDESLSSSDLNNSLIIAVSVSAGVAVGLLVFFCLAYIIYKLREKHIRRRNEAAAANEPVIYHGVATEARPVDSNRRYNNPLYSTTSDVKNATIQPLLPDSQRPTPSVPEYTSDS